MRAGAARAARARRAKRHGRRRRPRPLAASQAPAPDPPPHTPQHAARQVTALLQSEEEVHAPYARRGAQAPPPAGAGGAGAAAAGGACAMRVLHSELTTVTAHLLTSQFTVSIPPNAQPSFRTPLVTHRWALRFELCLAPAGGGGGGGGGAKRGAPELLVWTLPLAVCPPAG